MKDVQVHPSGTYLYIVVIHNLCISVQILTFDRFYYNNPKAINCNVSIKHCKLQVSHERYNYDYLALNVNFSNNCCMVYTKLFIHALYKNINI